jgi:hypothetical protein
MMQIIHIGIISEQYRSFLDEIYDLLISSRWEGRTTKTSTQPAVARDVFTERPAIE